MTTLPSRAQIVDLAADGPTMALRFGDLRDFVAQLPGAAADTELTIGAGAITPTGFVHRVDTEADAAADDLDNILQTNLPDGSLLILAAENPARVVTLRHAIGGAGELILNNNENFALNHAGRRILLRRKGTQWIEEERWSLFGRRVAGAADAAALRALADAAALGTANVFTKTQTWKDGGDVASAAALALGDGNVFNVTGTTAITSIGAKGVGTVVWLRFAGALTLTHHATDLVLLTGANIATAAGDWACFEEYAAGDWRMIHYARASGKALVESVTGMPRGSLAGLSLANNAVDATNDIDIAAGAARDSTNAIDLVLSAALTKRLDAGWAAGTNQGMRNSAAAIADTTYHIYLVAKAGGADADIYAHTSAAVATVLTALQAETGGAAYVYARRIGSILRESGAIVRFVQYGDEFWRKAPVLDVDHTNPGTTAVTRTLSVPTGISVRAFLNVRVRGAANSEGCYLSDLALDDLAVSNTAAPLHTVGIGANSSLESAAQAIVRTNTSAQIRSRMQGSNASAFLRVTTLGWLDRRGRDD